MATTKLSSHSVQGHLLTPEQAAKHLAISTKTLYRLRCAGEIAYIKVGGSVRFSPDDLAEFEARKRVAPGGYAEPKVDRSSLLNLTFETKKRGRGPRRR